MEITLELIKKLRDLTGVSITECKNALTETGGNIDAAVEELRKKGIAKAGKRAENVTNEGRLLIEQDGNKAYIVSLTCETDFVARTDNFAQAANNCLALLKSASSQEEARSSIEAKIPELIHQMGENMRLGQCEVITGDAVGIYLHSNGKVGSVVTAQAWADAEKLRQVAMHVTATSPSALSAADFPAELVAKEREIQMEQMKNDPAMSGKPEQVLGNILEGKIKKFVSENTLTLQPFVMSPDQTVAQFIGEGVLVSFKRVTL